MSPEEITALIVEAERTHRWLQNGDVWLSPAEARAIGVKSLADTIIYGDTLTWQLGDPLDYWREMAMGLLEKELIAVEQEKQE
jgi:hypothetical protein